MRCDASPFVSWFQMLKPKLLSFLTCCSVLPAGRTPRSGGQLRLASTPAGQDSLFASTRLQRSVRGANLLSGSPAPLTAVSRLLDSAPQDITRDGAIGP